MVCLLVAMCNAMLGWPNSVITMLTNNNVDYARRTCKGNHYAVHTICVPTVLV